MNYTITAGDVQKWQCRRCGALPLCGEVHGSKLSQDPADITDGCIQSLQLRQVGSVSVQKQKPQQNSIPQKWTSGDAQLVFPQKTKLDIMLLRKK
jgi:hypothetical protein